MKLYYNIPDVIRDAKEKVLRGHEMPAGRWQGTDKFSDQVMLEHINFAFTVAMPESPYALQEVTRCDMPWAEDHFQERVGGKPLNPGETYKKWPFNTFKQDGTDPFLKQGKFSHTYMERYWPQNQWGIRYLYGDLSDVINQLRENPYTRQAYLPVWFPEDTGAKHGERVPCTIGYHFLIRGNALSVNYYIRSCDFYRHFKNDIYLTVRLAQHVRNCVLSYWNRREDYPIELSMGLLTMHVGSLHIFKNDIYLMKKGNY